MRMPWRVCECVGEWIAIKDCVFAQHARAGSYVQKCIAVIENLRCKGGDGECDHCCDQRNRETRVGARLCEKKLGAMLSVDSHVMSFKTGPMTERLSKRDASSQNAYAPSGFQEIFPAFWPSW